MAAVLGVMTMMGGVGPWWLLGMTFALGTGSAMNGPAWAATIPELVPREELAAAVALNSVGFNIARAMGPALGGIVMAASNAGAVFRPECGFVPGSDRGVVALANVRGASKEPAPRLKEAMRAGLDYVRRHARITRC